MKTNIQCAFCDGSGFLRHEKGIYRYKGEDIEVAEWFYECEQCGEEFTTTETDTETQREAIEKYEELIEGEEDES